MMNVVDFIFETANRSAPALIAGERMLTYGQLLKKVDEVADQLRQLGVCKANGVPRIGLSCPNGLDYIVFALAILRAGGCLGPVASELSAPERDKLVLSTGLHAVVIPPGGEWKHSLSGKIYTICVSGIHQTCENAAAGSGVATDAEFTATLLTGLRNGKSAPLVFDEVKLSALNPAFIRFSSGTTGKSKGVVLSHQTLLDRVTVANLGLKIGPTDRVIWVLPMAHHFAVSIMLYLIHGAVTVIVDSHYPGDILSAARQQKGTVVYGAPFHYALLAAEDSGLPWPGLRLAISTAASLPLATAQRFKKRFGVPLSQALGMIEVGLPFLNVDSPHEKPESVGRPLPGFLVSIRNETGGGQAIGLPGELWIKGPGMLDAYLAPWRVQDEILEQGWFQTGDLASLDSEGLIRICGRVQSVINVGGMKCFPEEIEAVLSAHPAIQSARVFAIPHPKFGMVPGVDLVACAPANPPTVIELLSYCRSALAAFKIPVEFNFVQALSLTASGKVQR